MGFQRTDNRGAILLDNILKFNLTLLNDSTTTPIYCTTHGSSWIDLVMMNNYIEINLVHDFKVNDDIILSDHRLLTFKYGLKRNLITSSTMMNLKFVDRWKFSMGMNKIMSIYRNINSESVVNLIDSITKGIQEMYKY